MFIRERRLPDDIGDLTSKHTLIGLSWAQYGIDYYYHHHELPSAVSRRALRSILHEQDFYRHPNLCHCDNH